MSANESEGFGKPEFQLPKFSGGIFRGAVLVVLVLILVFTSLYTVDPEEVALVLRFGRYVRTTNPGLHLKVPFGIERALKVPIQRQLKEEFGFRTVSAGVRRSWRGEGLHPFDRRSHSDQADRRTT